MLCTINDIVHKIDCEVYDFKDFHILITALYRCHDLKNLKLVEVTQKVISKQKAKYHIIVGDFNIDILKVEPESEELLNNFLSAGYMPIVNSVTRPNDTGGGCIDNTYVKTELDLNGLKHA